MKSKLQTGFSAVEGLLVVLVLVAVGAVGYFAMNRSADNPTASTTTTTTSSEPTAPEVKTTADLTDAEKTVDTTELDAADSELDTELDKF